MHTKAVGARRKWTAFDWINTVFLVLLSAVFLYPLLMTLGLSFSSAKALVGQNVILLPKGFTLQSYQTILSDPSILRYYWNTIVYAGTGTLTSLLLTSLMAYPLTVAEFKGKKLINVLLLVTMFFGGGMIPFYFTLKDLHLTNTLWGLIIPFLISTYNMIILRTSFESIPESLVEAARIDGAGHFKVLFRIILPLSKAILAVMVLYYGVGTWNSWFWASIILRDREMYPLQVILREILLQNSLSNMTTGVGVADSESVAATVKYATIMVATLPILVVYPFLQKYFASGVMIGAVKE